MPACVWRAPPFPCACVLRLLPVAAARIGKCQVGAGFPRSSPLPPLTAPARTSYPGTGPAAMTNGENQCPGQRMGVQYSRENVAGGAGIDVAVLPAPSRRSPPFGLSVSLTPVFCTAPRIPPSRAHLESPLPRVPTPRVLGPYSVFSLLSSKSSFWPLQAISRGQSWLSRCCSTREMRESPSQPCFLILSDGRRLGRTKKS